MLPLSEAYSNLCPALCSYINSSGQGGGQSQWQRLPEDHSAALGLHCGAGLHMVLADKAAQAAHQGQVQSAKNKQTDMSFYVEQR